MNEETEALKELQAMNAEELAKVPADVYKWLCCVEGCEHFSRLYSFATFPVLFWKSKRQWIDIRRHLLFCARHWKQYGGLKFVPVIDEESGKQKTPGLKCGWGFHHINPTVKPESVKCTAEQWEEFINKQRNPSKFPNE